MESSVWKKDSYLKVFLWCLLKANHGTIKFPFNGGDITIGRGQFITGMRQALKELKSLTPMQWRSALSYLKKTGRINIQTTNRFTIITVCNYDIYQNERNTHNKPKQQPGNKQITTNKNDKNIYNTGEKIFVKINTVPYDAR